MTIPDFLTMSAYDEVFLTGHRIGLHHLIYYYNEGYSPEMLIGQFPTLPLFLVHKVIGYYLENQPEVDTYLAKLRVQLDEARAKGKHVDVVALRQRLKLLQEAESSAKL